MLATYEHLIGRHARENACVFGAGTSLHGQNFNFVHEHVVISVNSSIMLMPWHNKNDGKRYWLSNDALVRHWSYWDTIKKSHATKLVRDSWQKYFDEIPEFLQFSVRNENIEHIDGNDKLLCGVSSIPTAIDLAIQMGCRRIFIYGLDQYAYMNKYHFYDFLPNEQKPKFSLGRLPVNVITKCYADNQRIFPLLQKFADNKNCKIYNCNTRSAIDSFQKITIEESSQLLLQVKE